MKIELLKFGNPMFGLLAILIISNLDYAICQKTLKDRLSGYQKTTIDSVLIEWKADMLGCKGFRNLYKAQLLVENFNLSGQYPARIIELLGKPDRIIIERQYYALSYFYGTICNVSPLGLPNGSEFCWIDFAYKDSNSNKCLIIPQCH